MIKISKNVFNMDVLLTLIELNVYKSISKIEKIYSVD